MDNSEYSDNGESNSQLSNMFEPKVPYFNTDETSKYLQDLDFQKSIIYVTKF